MEKFHHLKHCLEGSAETLIHPLAVIGDNYSRAWAIIILVQALREQKRVVALQFLHVHRSAENEKRYRRGISAAFTISRLVP